MSNPFAAPAPPGEGITWADHKDRLLLIEPLAYEDHVPTVHTKAGEKSPAVRANVTVLDGDDKGDVYSDTLIFPKLLVSQTKSKLGEKVLGRLTQGDAQAGKNPPWLLDPASPEDIETGVRYLAHREKTSISQPTPANEGAEPVPF